MTLVTREPKIFSSAALAGEIAAAARTSSAPIVRHRFVPFMPIPNLNRRHGCRSITPPPHANSHPLAEFNSEADMLIGTPRLGVPHAAGD